MFGIVGLENEPEHNRDQRYPQYNHLFDLIGLFIAQRAPSGGKRPGPRGSLPSLSFFFK